ncbi:MAG TPA: family 1 glycosylhydrolase [Planktothrix sp.]
MFERTNIAGGRLPDFTWAVGIEDTFVPQAKPGMRPLEEYELTQHYEQWRRDIDRAAALGVKMMRWGVPWYRVETNRGEYDWQWVDAVLQHMRRVGIEPIVDIVHYGTPLWLANSFANPTYPQAVASFAGAFAQRYKRLVRHYVPLNEPTVNADFSGRRALWPPYLQGDKGYVQVLLNIASGIQLSARAIGAANPDAVLFAVEATNRYRPDTDSLAQTAELSFRKDVLCFDLVQGQVNENHPLFRWLMRSGASEWQLEVLRRQPVSFDVFGINFYPWSSLRVVDSEGSTQPGPDDGRAMLDVIRKVHAHAQLPIYITETSAVGERRSGWMQEVIDAVKFARIEGVPVIGLTWFPFFSMIEWDYRTSEKPIEQHLLHLGLLDAYFEGGALVRRETKLVAQFQTCMKVGMPPIALLRWSKWARFWHRIWWQLVHLDRSPH